MAISKTQVQPTMFEDSRDLVWMKLVEKKIYRTIGSGTFWQMDLA